MLLYVSDSWVVTGSMLRVMERFHHQTEKRITGMTAQCTTSWECPPVAEALETSGPWPIKEYIQHRQDTVAEQVA